MERAVELETAVLVVGSEGRSSSKGRRFPKTPLSDCLEWLIKFGVLLLKLISS